MFSSTPTPAKCSPTLKRTLLPNTLLSLYPLPTLTLAFLQSAAEKHAHNTAAYCVDVEKYPAAKEYFKVTTVPTVVVYKDGKQIKKAEGMNAEKAKEVAAVLV